MKRRQFLKQTAFGAAFFTTSGLFAEQLVPTARVGEGPFYPDKMPLDTDNDLLIINDSITPAIGQITHLAGRILNSSGQPIRNAFVEIWQVDNKGAYIHTDSANRRKRDSNFQGYGRFLTDSKGHYYFRTIKPVRVAFVHTCRLSSWLGGNSCRGLSSRGSMAAMVTSCPRPTSA